jgi:hypothetical protein
VQILINAVAHNNVLYPKGQLKSAGFFLIFLRKNGTDGLLFYNLFVEGSAETGSGDYQHEAKELSKCIKKLRPKTLHL